MGTYLLNPYRTDLLKRYVLKGFVQIISDNQSDQRSQRLTTEEEDRQFLPEIYLTNVSKFSNSMPDCYQLSRLRYVQLWISSNSFIQLNIPFFPRSNEFNLFFEQAKSNPDITAISYYGEKIEAYHLKNLR